MNEAQQWTVNWEEISRVAYAVPYHELDGIINRWRELGNFRIAEQYAKAKADRKGEVEPLQ